MSSRSLHPLRIGEGYGLAHNDRLPRLGASWTALGVGSLPMGNKTGLRARFQKAVNGRNLLPR